MKKKIKILISFGAIVVIVVLISIFTIFKKDTITETNATEKMKDYATMQYPQYDLTFSNLVVQEPSSDFKEQKTKYAITVIAEGNQDIVFDIFSDGRKIYDNYQYQIEEKNAVFQRIKEEYEKDVSNTLTEESDYKFSSILVDWEIPSGDPDLIKNNLNLGMEYNRKISNYFENKLSLEIKMDSITMNQIASILKDTNKTLDNQTFFIDVYSLNIKTVDGIYSINEISSENIQAENLEKNLNDIFNKDASGNESPKFYLIPYDKEEN